MIPSSSVSSRQKRFLPHTFGCFFRWKRPYTLFLTSILVVLDCALLKDGHFFMLPLRKRRLNIVSFVCRTVSLTWTLNMTIWEIMMGTLHCVWLSLRFFCSLYGKKEVLLNSANNNGETPIDLSKDLIPRGLYHTWVIFFPFKRCLCGAHISSFFAFRAVKSGYIWHWNFLVLIILVFAGICLKKSTVTN